MIGWLLIGWLLVFGGEPVNGIEFTFKGQMHALLFPMNTETKLGRYKRMEQFRLDTLSNYLDMEAGYVEIIRQDAHKKPVWGLALGFEFDETLDSFPYMPVYARIQIKDYRWGGPEFSVADTFNYSGLINEVSEDFTLQIDTFYNDTISGRFSGELLNGAGGMAAVTNGRFRCRLLRR